MSGAGWRDDLRALVDRAAAAEGRAPVAETLRGESERLSGQGDVPRLVVDDAVLGAVPVGAAWVGVLLAREAPPAVLAARTLGALVELARESEELSVAAIGQPAGDEVDTLSNLVEVIEVDPAASFSRIAGRPLRAARDAEDGVVERRALLARAGLVPPAWFRGSGFEEDDLLDACAAAWTAVRRASGLAEQPEGPDTTIWV